MFTTLPSPSFVPSCSLFYTISTTNVLFSTMLSTGIIFHINLSLDLYGQSNNYIWSVHHPSALNYLFSGNPTLFSLNESLL